MKLLKNKFVFFLVLFCLVAGILYGGRFIQTNRSNSKSASYVLKKEDLIQKVIVYGLIEPARKTIITAPYRGYVKKIFVKLGDLVKAQDPLATVVSSLGSSEQNFPLRAPFPGRVVHVEKKEGEFIKDITAADASEYIMRIDDQSRMYVLGAVAEGDRVKIKENHQATISIFSLPDLKLKAVVRDLSLSPKERLSWDRSAGVEFPVRLEILQPTPELKSGMSVLVEIVTARRDQVLALPHQYLLKENGQFFVLTPAQKKIPVEVGLMSDEKVEVKSGLSEKDTVMAVDYFQVKK